MSSSSHPRDGEWIRHVEGWARAGRGRGLTFFATDDEVVRFVEEGLPERYGPYRLVGFENVKVAPRLYEQRPFEAPLSDLMASFASGKSVWIHSLELLPSFTLAGLPHPGHVCSLNGLVHLQHGDTIDGRRRASDVSVVDHVEHLYVGVSRRFPAQREIFEALRKRIRRSLCYTSIQTFPGGKELEDDRLELMTEGAAQEAREGKLTRRVGRRLELRSRRR